MIFPWGSSSRFCGMAWMPYNLATALSQNSRSDTWFQRRLSSKGRAYFVLLARNGEVIGQSQQYVHDTSCYVGIRSVMTNARKAPLRENSKG